MKKIFTFILGVGTMLCANAQMAEGVQARIYAYDLQQEETTAVVNNTTVKAYNFTFKTNTAATGTPTVTLFGDGLNDVVIQATATDNTNKSWTATVHAANGEIVAGSYNWKVTVSADPVNSFSEIYNSLNNGFELYRSYGLSINKSPETKYFGKTYFVNQYTTGTHAPVGMYTVTPEIIIENPTNPYTPDMIGKNEASVNKYASVSNPVGGGPSDMCISEDGRLFMSNGSSTYAGIYYIDPETFSNSLVFTNINRTTNSNVTTITDKTTGEHVSGIQYYTDLYRTTVSLTTRGSGNNTQLIQHDPSNFIANGYTSAFHFYDIGNSNTWQGAPSSTITKMWFYGTESKVNSYRKCTAIDATKNGFWFVQIPDSNTPNDNSPTLFYYSDITGSVMYRTYTHISNTSSVALAVNEDLGLVAYTTKGASTGTPAVIIKYNENTTTGEIDVISINGTDYKMTSLGSKADAMDFDYAGNLWAITSGNEIMAVYALPDALVGENTRTTPAKSTLLAVFSDGDKLTSIDGINADANAPVEYYNLQGVKVENPEKGIFIKKQGSKTTKVVF